MTSSEDRSLFEGQEVSAYPHGIIGRNALGASNTAAPESDSGQPREPIYGVLDAYQGWADGSSSEGVGEAVVAFANDSSTMQDKARRELTSAGHDIARLELTRHEDDFRNANMTMRMLFDLALAAKELELSRRQGTEVSNEKIAETAGYMGRLIRKAAIAHGAQSDMLFRRESAIRKSEQEGREPAVYQKPPID